MPKLVLYAPYQAVYMGSYTLFRDHLHTLLGTSAVSGLVYPLAGIMADLASVPIRLPMEVLKQRMQAGRIRNVGEVLKSKDSLRALVSWRLFRAQTLLHDIPYGIVQWSAYAAVKSSLSDEAASDPITPVLAGTLSGGLAALITTPLDVIKTRCIISDHLPIRSIFHGVVKDGIWVLVSRGAVFRVLHIAPATGVYFGLFNLIYSGLAS